MREVHGLEPYHDRTRLCIVEQIHPQVLANRHLTLATALEKSECGEFSAISYHFRLAGEKEKAGCYALEAARVAARGLAFGEAAELYGQALDDFDSLGIEQRSQLARARADALGNAGRGREAGDAYLACLAFDPVRSIGLRRLAAEQYLTSGELDRGTEVLSSLLTDADLVYPKTRSQAIAAIVCNLLLLRFRGTRTRIVDDATLDPKVLTQIDLLLAAFRGYSTFCPTLGSYFALEALILSLRVGYCRGVMFTLSYLAIMFAYAGGKGDERRSLAILQQVAAVSRELKVADAISLCGILGQSVVAVALGRFCEAVDKLDRIRVQMERCVGVSWELSVIDNTRIQALIWSGQFIRAREGLRLFSRRGQQSGDRFAELTSAILDAKLRLADGCPAAARQQIDDVMVRWTTREFTFQHFFALKARVWCDLYEGHVWAAQTTVDAARGDLRSSGLLSLQLMRAEVYFLEGTILIARRDARLRVRLKGLARRLQQTGRMYARGYGATLVAGLSRVAGDRMGERLALEEALRAYTSAGMKIHASIMQMQLGDRFARSRLLEEGIAQPEQWSQIYYPCALI